MFGRGGGSKNLSIRRIARLSEDQTSILFHNVLVEYIQGRIIPLLGDIGQPLLLQKSTFDDLRKKIASIVESIIEDSHLSYDDKKEMLLTLAKGHRFSPNSRPRLVIISMIQNVLGKVGIHGVRSKVGGKREILLSPNKH